MRIPNPRGMARERFAVVVRRVGLLVLVVCCLVVPVVSIVVHALGAPDQGSMHSYCPDPTTPCELPQVIPTGRP
ncbi:MAG TPA: hypothetical protein VL551_16565 [Actinospica sp.]|nr:hypothetical protein [Actinospica sp.]